MKNLEDPFPDWASLLAFLKATGEEVRGARYDLETASLLLPAVAEGFFRPAVTVAGTNGKGSVCWWLARALREAGYAVGLYTSPHLHEETERVRLNGEPVSRGRFLAAARAVHASVEALQDRLPRRPTYYEWMTAIAARCFHEAKVDIHVLEVGMGGRLDAVNAADPVLSVITGVDLDHCRFLGPDLASIAREKMGILRPNAPVVLGPQDGWARGLEGELERKALRVVRAAGAGPLPEPLGLAGAHQAWNAATVLTACRELRALGWNVPEACVRTALAQGDWPGRMERLSSRPAVVVDGAHNPQGMAAAAAELRREAVPPVVVFGCMEDKDYPAMLEILLPAASQLVLTGLPMPRAAGEGHFRALECLRGRWAGEGGDCAAEAAGAGPRVRFEASPAAAIARAVRLAGENGTVYVLGSLFLAAEARNALIRP